MAQDSKTARIVDDRYIVQGVLGRGAMGCVVQAFDQLLGRRVALKLMKSGPPEALARFSREARAVARLQSEHVARVLDARVSSSGQPYIAMEYLVGHTLATLIERQGAFSPVVAVEYIAQACDALREAHSLSIIHRDIKPSNLFLAERRNGARLIKVLDFGISKGLGAGETAARLTMAATIVGTPKYISPERLQGMEPVDARSDVWSLGAVLYELVSGEPAFSGPTTAFVIANVVSGVVPDLRAKRPDVPRLLCAIVSKCLEPSPDRRYHNAGELGQALRAYLAEQRPTRTRSFEMPTVPSAVRPTPSQDPTDKVHVVRATPRAAERSSKRSPGVNVLGLAVIVAGATAVFSVPRWWHLVEWSTVLGGLRPVASAQVDPTLVAVVPPAPLDSEPQRQNAIAPVVASRPILAAAESTGIPPKQVAPLAAAPTEAARAVEVEALPTLEETLEKDRSRTKVSAQPARPSAKERGLGNRTSAVESSAARATRPRTENTPAVEARRRPPSRGSDEVDPGAFERPTQPKVARPPIGGGIELFDDIR
jgi:serine/threonine protein kinase